MSLRPIKLHGFLAFPSCGWRAVMTDEQDTLEHRVVAALLRADADRDCLIAALLSQCLDLIRRRAQVTSGDQPLGARRL